MKSTHKLSTATVLGLAIALALAAGGPAAAGDRMTPSEIADTFSGMTLDGVYGDGSFFSETYFDDGSIRYHDINGADSGRWSVRGDRFCTFYRSLQGACFFVERDGANCYTFYEGAKGDPNAAEPAKEWTSRGWNRTSAATCPVAPAASI